MGFLDFITMRPHLPLAGGGDFDLAQDERRANQLLRQAEGDTFQALYERWLVPDHNDASTRRFTERYARVEEQAGERHGQAIMDKVDAHLQHSGQPALHGSWTLESGGGIGRFVWGFSRRFAHVAFVDCSLVNLLLAHRLAQEQGVAGVLFVRADVTALPFPAGQFDFVHQNGVIEHVHDPVAMLEESLRVRARDGVYACLSPNRFPLTPEPHFRLPLFGLFPRPARIWIIKRTRGATSEAGTDLLSLSELRRAFGAAGVRDVPVFFLPPRLPSIARQTLLRRAVQRLLDLPFVGSLSARFINGLLLPIMPYHLAVVTGPMQWDGLGPDAAQARPPETA